MTIDVALQRAQLSVGEFSEFTLGPKDSSGGTSGLWRAQLGTHWHRELQKRTTAEFPAASFEVVIEGDVAHLGWVISLGGRMDQTLEGPQGPLVREIKSVTRTLPAPEDELRAQYPSYFIQAATYGALLRQAGRPHAVELVFVEADSGLAQSVPLTRQDEVLFRNQLEQLGEFLRQRSASRKRLAALSFRRPFETLRAGQETTAADLTRAVLAGRSAVLLEAPTGFGKTGILLESALTLLKSGHFERVIYLTGKSTGQWHVASTLASMTAPGDEQPADFSPIGVWQVRNKAEHCINETFLCVREACSRIEGAQARWKKAGLGAFVGDPRAGKDMESLRSAGRQAHVCPYEITRVGLGFSEVWIGDINYVFSPSVRPLFYEQPGFDPARTLLIVDEAHNLPSRVADGYSSTFSGSEAWSASEALSRIRAHPKLVSAWQAWTRFLDGLPESPALSAADEDDARHLLGGVADRMAEAGVDYAILGAEASQTLWRTIEASPSSGQRRDLPSLWWSPRAGHLHITCLDAAAALGESLRDFAGVILSTATPGPTGAFARALGLAGSAPKPVVTTLSPPERLGELTKRETRKLHQQLARGSDLLRAAEEEERASLFKVEAAAPWRAGAYDVAYDLRVDTSFQRRAEATPVTAETILRFQQSLGPVGKVAVFLPSYAYLDIVSKAVAALPHAPALSLQPRRADLTAQASWVDQSLALADVLFLVLGSSFAEGVDLLGGRVQGAIVVGPALPEVNPVQRARLAAYAPLGREEAVETVYRIPGMQKVNQALGRLVRAPGQRARILLHCRRFGEAQFQRLLGPEYLQGTFIHNDRELETWLGRRS